jgi:hypothetical protein
MSSRLDQRGRKAHCQRSGLREVLECEIAYLFPQLFPNDERACFFHDLRRALQAPRRLTLKQQLRFLDICAHYRSLASGESGPQPPVKRRRRPKKSSDERVVVPVLRYDAGGGRFGLVVHEVLKGAPARDIAILMRETEDGRFVPAIVDTFPGEVQAVGVTLGAAELAVKRGEKTDPRHRALKHLIEALADLCDELGGRIGVPFRETNDRLDTPFGRFAKALLLRLDDGKRPARRAETLATAIGRVMRERRKVREWHDREQTLFPELKRVEDLAIRHLRRAKVLGMANMTIDKARAEVWTTTAEGAALYASYVAKKAKMAEEQEAKKAVERAKAKEKRSSKKAVKNRDGPI